MAARTPALAATYAAGMAALEPPTTTAPLADAHRLPAPQKSPAQRDLQNQLGSLRSLVAVSDLIIGWKLLQQAEIAVAHSTPTPDPFYEGKVVTAVFFAKTILPEISSTRAIIEEIDNGIMTLAETAF